MIGRCANVASLEDRMIKDEILPDTAKLIAREGTRQGTEVITRSSVGHASSILRAIKRNFVYEARGIILFLGYA